MQLLTFCKADRAAKANQHPGLHILHVKLAPNLKKKTPKNPNNKEEPPKTKNQKKPQPLKKTPHEESELQTVTMQVCRIHWGVQSGTSVQEWDQLIPAEIRIWNCIKSSLSIFTVNRTIRGALFSVFQWRKYETHNLISKIQSCSQQDDAS